MCERRQVSDEKREKIYSEKRSELKQKINTFHIGGYDDDGDDDEIRRRMPV